MEIKLRIVGEEEPLIEIKTDDLDNQKSHFYNNKISLQKGNTDQILITSLFSEAIVLLDFKMYFTTQQKIHYDIIGESIMMNFIGSDNVEVTANQIDENGISVENTHNILYSNNLNGTLQIPANIDFTSFSIVLSLDYYRYLIHDEWGLHQNFSKSISQKKAGYLTLKYVPFSPVMQWVIHEIRNSKYEGSIQKIYIEAKIKELLILQLDTLIEKPLEKVLVHEEDYVKLLQAKLILEANFTNAPSLPELSRAISLNEFKLKKGFKSCFETTVKGYITKLRMECAKDLFKNKASSVSEVAYKCGYKDVSHFSAAFKLFYGFTPISFRKLNKITK